MSKDNIQRVAELIRNEQYEVNPVAVADGVLRRVIWDDVPDIEPLLPSVALWRRVVRLRSKLRWRRRASVTVRTRPQLSA